MEEKEKNQNQDTKKPLTIRYATYIYAAMAVCIVTVLAVSIFSMSYDVPDELTVSLPEVSLPSVIDNNSQGEKPVGGEQSGVPADVSEPQTQTPESPEFCHPVSGKIIKSYSVTALVFSETMKDYRTHSGIDIAAPVGTAVNAYADGVIASVTDDALMGITVTITHDGGVTSVYRNLSKTVPDNIKTGVSVKAGEIIGAVGDTAIVEAFEEPHLHFELLLDGKTIDPEKELNAID